MAETSRKLEDILSRYREALAGLGVRVEKFYLFGSHRAGNPREGSDIDLVVISPDFARLDFMERLKVLGIAAARIREPIEARGFTSAEVLAGELTPFWKHVLSELAVLV